MEKEINREFLIDTIYKNSNEEYENKKDLWELAKKSNNELIKIVVDILNYYKNNL